MDQHLAQDPAADTLLSDPLYQLNLLIWLLMEIPPGTGIRPLLREGGFVLEALARPLPVPPEALARLVSAGLLSSQQPTPDVVARQAAGPHWLLLEAKGHGFGVTSSNARQARGLLAGGHDLRGTVGLPPSTPAPGIVTYVTPERDAAPMATTLGTLRNDMAEAGVSVARCAALGLTRRPDGVYLHDQHPAGVFPEPLNHLLAEPQRVQEVDAETDPRPLYIVPWDPGLDQSTEGARHGRRVLQEKLRSATLACIGTATVPGKVELPLDDLLHVATGGMSRIWRDRSQIQGLRTEVRRFLLTSLRAAEGSTPTTTSLVDVPGLLIDLPSEQARELVMDRLRLPLPAADLTAKGLTQLPLPDLL